MTNCAEDEIVVDEVLTRISKLSNQVSEALGNGRSWSRDQLSFRRLFHSPCMVTGADHVKDLFCLLFSSSTLLGAILLVGKGFDSIFSFKKRARFSAVNKSTP